MAYRKTVGIARLDNGPGVRPSYRHDPGDRRKPWIWFAEEDMPDWARAPDGVVVMVEIEKTGRKRPAWRIVGPG